MRKALIGLLALASLAVAVAGYFAFSIRGYVTSPLTDSAHRFSVKPGASLRSVLSGLKDDGVLDKPEWVYYYARYRKLTSVKVGQYELPAGATPVELLQTLAKGQVLTESFSIPEGFNRWQIRDVLDRKGWIDAKTFDGLCDDGAFLKEADIPGPSCEGYLYPETYTFARGVSAKAIFKEMFAQWRSNMDSVLDTLGAGPLKLDRRQFTTLASIVEKETGASEERPRIGLKLHDRLRLQ
ncbi:MAG: endolytic transglycosylase MltG, partial [Myxococcota bacterium]